MQQQEARILAPTRDDLAMLYRVLVARKETPFQIQALLGTLDLKRFNLGKLLLCLEALEERKLISSETEGDLWTVHVLETAGKVDVFASGVFETMRTLIHR